MIKPTVGRIVHYYAATGEQLVLPDAGEPLAAVVVRVPPQADRVVNLTVFDANGNSHPRQSIQLVQPEDRRPPAGVPFCAWMPYQLDRASKEAATNASIDDVS